MNDGNACLSQTAIQAIEKRPKDGGGRSWNPWPHRYLQVQPSQRSFGLCILLIVDIEQLPPGGDRPRQHLVQPRRYTDFRF